MKLITIFVIFTFTFKMFVHNKANCISQLNNDYINAIRLTLCFKMLIFEINFFWDININRIFLTERDYTQRYD